MNRLELFKKREINNCSYVKKICKNEDHIIKKF